MSFPRYPKYRDSGVEWLGDVPAHWDVKRLKHFCHAFPSNVDKKSYEGEVPVLLCNYTDVYYNDHIVAGMDFMSATASPDQVAKFTLRAGDTIITKDSETADDIAVGAYVPVDLPGVVCGYHLSVVRPNANVHGAFVKRIFDSTFAKSCFAVRANGLTRVGLGQYELDNVDLPFPPFAEQAAIAAFLDRETAKIDALVAEQQRLVELLKEKRQAVIFEAFIKGLSPHAIMKPSGNIWLGEVPAHWEVMRLKHIKAKVRNAFVDGPFGSNLKSEHFIDGGEVYVIESGFATQGVLDVANMKTISMKHFRDIDRSEARAGDIIIAKIGAQFGKSSILPRLDKPAVVSGNALKLTVNSDLCDVTFVYWYLVNIKDLGIIDDIVAGSAQPALSLGGMNNLPMLLPPRSEQEAMVRLANIKADEFDTLTREAERAIALLRERRTALVSAAVTGQIDVRGQTATGVA